MPSARGMIRRQARFCFGIAVAASLLLSLPMVWAQYPLEYPAKSEVSKDGTAILIEDYATPPLSSASDGPRIYPPPIDYHGQLARVVSMRSEPANAPLASSRFFVDDMNGNLYILDKATRKFTPYITFAEIFPKYNTDRFDHRGVCHRVRSKLCEKRQILYRAHGNPSQAGLRPADQRPLCRAEARWVCDDSGGETSGGRRPV